MKRSTIQKEIAVAVLGGNAGTQPVLDLFRKGLTTFYGVRLGLRSNGLQSALTALRKSKTGRDYVRVSLSRGVTVRIHLSPDGTGAPLLRVNGNPPLVTIEPATGNPRQYFDVPTAAAALVPRVKMDVESIVRVLLGIDRARKRCYELCEEGTRWL